MAATAPVARDFRGKVVIVTGSSNGIGRATAKLFAQLGAKVTITGRSAQSAAQTREILKTAGALDENICEVLGDLTDDAIAKKIVDDTVAKFGKIDVLVNNAGGTTCDDGGLGFAIPIDSFDYTMRVNVRSIILLVQHAQPFLELTQGAVVNVSSIAAHHFTSGSLNPYYAISKSAVDQLTVQLAGRLIEKNIRVNAVNPGLIKTEIFSKLGMSDTNVDKMYDMHTQRNIIPIGRMGEPDDIAKVIVFLSDRSQSEFVIGQRLVTDGGSNLRNELLSSLFVGLV